MVANAAPESRTLPVLIDSDYGFAVCVGILGFSVGYIGNLCLIQAPKMTGKTLHRYPQTQLIRFF